MAVGERDQRKIVRGGVPRKIHNWTGNKGTAFSHLRERAREMKVTGEERGTR
jgi:hypothetical protein